MSYLSEILTALPVNTDFKMCATLVELDKAWQCCERFESHAIKIRPGCEIGEFIVRIIPHHDEIDALDAEDDKACFALGGICFGALLLWWVFS